MWFELPVLDGLHARLSASAVDTYERCGLQFKLDRDWRIDRPSRPQPCNMAPPSIASCKTYFDSVNLGRPKTDDELIDLFPPRSGRRQNSGTLPARTLRETGHRAAARFSRRGPLAPIAGGSCTPSNRLRFAWARPPWSAASIASTAGPTAASPSSTTRPAKPAIRKMPTRACSCPSTRSPPRRNGDIDVGALIFYNLEENVPVITDADRGATDRRAQSRGGAAQGIADGIFDAKPGIHCNFCAYRSLCPEKEKRIPHPRGEHRQLARANYGTCDQDVADTKFLHTKNLGDALERPLVYFVLNFLSASFSSLPFSWLPLVLFSLPFFMENFATVFYCN